MPPDPQDNPRTSLAFASSWTAQRRRHHLEIASQPVSNASQINTVAPPPWLFWTTVNVDSMKYADKLTIVIPTYNRPKHLKRSLNYWGRADYFNVIVADGSVERFGGEIPSNANYFYDNKQRYVQRWIDGLKKVKTPYVAICAEDDFLSFNGLKTCIDFLNNHADYVSTQGHAIAFNIDERKNIRATMLNLKMIGHHIDGNTANERLNQLFSDEYIYQIYSVYRTEILRLAFEACIEQENGYYYELGAAIIPTIFGKHKVLPIFYSAREYIFGSAGNVYEAPRFDILKPEGLIEYENWRDKIARILSETEGVSFDAALIVIEDIFKQYNAWDLRTFPNRKPLGVTRLSFGSEKKYMIRKYIKKIMPARLLAARRKYINCKLAGKSLGYPWTDRGAACEWQIMVDVIKRHDTSNQEVIQPNNPVYPTFRTLLQQFRRIL